MAVNKVASQRIIDRSTSNISKNSVSKILKEGSFDEHLSWLRRLALRIVRSFAFEMLVAFIFVLNVVFIIIETDIEAEAVLDDEGVQRQWMHTVNLTFLFFYCLELALRIYAMQDLFFRVPVNVIDLFVVALDVCLFFLQVVLTEVDMPNVLVLRGMRFFRLVRLARACRIFMAFRELYIMVHGLISSMRAVFWASTLILLALVVCAILAVEFLHPLNVEVARSGQYENCDRCPRAFETVVDSMVTFMQTIIASDSWGAVSIPIIERYPWTLPIFVTILLGINLGLMNLVMTAIVEHSSKSRDEDYFLRMKEKQVHFAANRGRLEKVFQDIDADKDGLLTMAEFIEGYEHEECFKIFQLMDVGREELELVYEMMDTDGSGRVDYNEFIEQIHAMQTRDQRILIMFMSAKLNYLSDTVNRKIDNITSALFQVTGLRQEAKDVDYITDIPCAYAADTGPSPSPHDRPDTGASPSFSVPSLNRPMQFSQVASNTSASSLNATLQRLARNIEEDLLSNLQAVSKQLEKEVATNLKNTELLASLRDSVPPARSGAVFTPLLDGGSPVWPRGDPVVARMLDQGASTKVGRPSGGGPRNANPDAWMLAPCSSCTPDAPS